MFNIYLTNWIDEVEEEVQDGHNEPELQTNYYLIDEETLIMSVPFSEGEEPCMINPTIKSEMGKAESLDFTINPGMKYYNSYQELKTLIRVEYKESLESEDAETIFFGRVITINTSNLLAIKSIHAEGAYSVLQDTPIEGLEQELQPKIGQWALFGNIIGEHNDWIGDDNDDSWKQMRVVGLNSIESPISFKDEPDKKCAPTSWNTSMAAIDDLIGNNGGYMKVRYDPTSFPYLKIEWHRKYFRDYGDPIAHPNCERPSFELAKNIIDLSSTDEISELFTRVIPIGHKASTKKNSKETSFIYVPGKYMSVKSIRPSDNWLEDNFQSLDEFIHAEDYYGIIYKTVNFPNADTVGKLEEYVTDWIKRNYFGALRSFTVKAIDMKMVNMDRVQNSLILAGDCVDISYPYFDKDGKRHMTTETRLVCKSAQIVLFNPEQNVYTIGVPNDAVDFEYGERKKPKKAGSSTIAGSTSAPPPSNSTVYDLDFDAAYSYLRWFYYANDWGDIATAQSYCAYSWRCGGMLSRDDQVPANSFRANGLPKHEFVEIVDKPIYDPAYPGDPEHIIGYEPTSTEMFDYYYVKIAGLSNVRLMGHYTMSKVPNGLEPGVTPPGYNITNGYTYGFGYVEGTDDAVAFSWNEYTSGKGNPEDSSSAAIEALFHFPNLFGNHSLGSLSNPDTGANKGTTDEEGNPGWVDSDGNVIVKIFPDLGTIGVGYGYQYETNPDGSVKEDANGNPILLTDENGDPIVLTDENGNPVWAISINEPITYLGSDNKMHTIPSGNLVVNDLKLPGIPSFMTQLAAINTAIIGNANIANAIITNLRAIIADIGDYDDVEGLDLDTLFEDVFHYEDPTGNVVQVFSASKKYSVGDKVVYENVVYRFIHSHSKGPWDPTDVEELGDATKVDHLDANGNKIVKVKEGTRFANTTNQIQGVAGRFVLNSDGSMTILEGGGIKIGTDDTAFGIWHKGNMTAGIMCTMINDDSTAQIYGNNIIIGSEGTKAITLGSSLRASGGYINVEYPMYIRDQFIVDNEKGETVQVLGDFEANEIKSYYNYVVDTNAGDKTYNVLDITLNDNNTVMTITKVDPSNGEVSTLTFNKAASLTGKWSGSSSAPTFPLTVYAHPQGTTISTGNESYISDKYKISTSPLGNDDKGVQIDLICKTKASDSSAANPTVSGAKATNVTMPAQIVRLTTSSGSYTPTITEVYSKDLLIPAWPVWNNAANSVNFPVPLTDSQIEDTKNYSDIIFGYPKKINGISAGATDTKSYSLVVLDNVAYIEDPDGENCAKVIHNKYKAGKESVKHVITNFVLTNSSTYTYKVSATKTISNNSKGYYIDGDDENATVRIIGKPEWLCDNNPRESPVDANGNTTILVTPTAVTNVYKKGYSNGHSKGETDGAATEAAKYKKALNRFVASGSSEGKIELQYRRNGNWESAGTHYWYWHDTDSIKNKQFYYKQ